MSVEVVENVDVEVNMLTMTANFVSNTVFHSLSRIIQERGLSLDYLTENRKIIEDGIFIWVTEQSLQSLVLEVFRDGTDIALERFDYLFTYVADPVSIVSHPSIDRLTEFCRKLNSLPSEAKYRILVTLKAGATQVAGWSPTDFKKIQSVKEVEQGDWGFGFAGVKLIYKGGDLK